MYAFGEGVSQDHEQAVNLFRKAADQGKASAQYFLGLMYINGSGVNQDYNQAIKWIRKAAEQGYVKAQSSLVEIEQLQHE